jgi:predicted nuclease of predicted toxin-antitoxin system
VGEQGLAGVADPAVAAVRQVEKRAIVTLDLDFSDIRRYPPEN